MITKWKGWKSFFLCVCGGIICYSTLLVGSGSKEPANMWRWEALHNYMIIKLMKGKKNWEEGMIKNGNSIVVGSGQKKKKFLPPELGKAQRKRMSGLVSLWESYMYILYGRLYKYREREYVCVCYYSGFRLNAINQSFRWGSLVIQTGKAKRKWNVGTVNAKSSVPTSHMCVSHNRVGIRMLRVRYFHSLCVCTSVRAQSIIYSREREAEKVRDD